MSSIRRHRSPRVSAPIPAGAIAVSALLLLAACTDYPLVTSPHAAPPSFDLSILATSSTMGVTPRDLGRVNVPGTGPQVCNSASIRGAGEPGGGTGRTWLGTKVDRPARTFVAGGFRFTLSSDDRSANWTSIAADTYAGTSNVMTAVLIKAGNNTSVYYYNPSFTTDADGVPPNAGTISTNPADHVIRADAALGGGKNGIGYVVVCYVERLFEPSIRVEATASTHRLRTDPVDYNFIITNTSPAGTPKLTCDYDSEIGRFTGFELDAGEVENVEEEFRLNGTQPDPFVVTIVVTCAMAGSTEPITASATASTDIVSIAFELEMTASPTVGAGGAVEYVMTVRNNSPNETPPVPCRIVDDLGTVNKQFDSASGSVLVERTSYILKPTDTSPLRNETLLLCGFTDLSGVEIKKDVSTTITN